jgi:hypothetical protein
MRFEITDVKQGRGIASPVLPLRILVEKLLDQLLVGSREELILS